ncbi:MAG: FadR family transcriptional regulator [Pseudomonadota bacterium]|nr:FadR family transcriptional regulator [Pseudomonadota bacterium]
MPDFQKRSDFMAEVIKSRIVSGHYRPGERLPNEKELLAEFGLSKGTVREALKSLEVQGLVKLTTGPRGGATIREIDEARAMQLLSAYFFFNTPSARDLYEVRCRLEPEMAQAATGRLSAEQLKRMEALNLASRGPAADHKERRQQRLAELEFHNVISEASPNPLLAFMCRFLNRLLADLVVFRDMHMAPHAEFGHDNCSHHEKLIEAFRAGDGPMVAKIMTEHMESARRYMVDLEAEVDLSGFLTSVRSNRR